VSDTDGPGIFAIARGSDCSLTARILNNTVAAPDTTTAARAGIRVDSGSATGDTTLCLEISGNTTAGSTNTSTSTTSPGINLRKQGTSTTVNIFGIEGLSPSPTGTPNVENHVNGLNTSTSGTFGVNGTALLSATSGFTNCVAP
jgi:large repetitive protein